MALVKLDNPPTVPTLISDWTDFVAREDVTNNVVGFNVDTFTLSEWDASSTNIPQVKQGSWAVVGGTVYQADSDTALTLDAGLSDGQCRIKLVPSGTQVIPTLTNDSIPTWDAEQSGWYDSDDMFLPYEMTKSGTSYINKFQYVLLNNLVFKAYTTGALDIAGGITSGGSLAVSGGGTFGGNVSATGAGSFGDNITFENQYNIKTERYTFTTGTNIPWTTYYTAPVTALCFLNMYSVNSNGTWNALPPPIALNSRLGLSAEYSIFGFGGPGVSAALIVRGNNQSLQFSANFSGGATIDIVVEVTFIERTT